MGVYYVRMAASLELAPEVQSFQERHLGPDTKLSLPRQEEWPAGLVDIALRVAEVSKTWNPVELYTADPDDISTHREEVFKAYREGRVHNPTFSYPQAANPDIVVARTPLMTLLGEVRSFDPGKDRAYRLARVALAAKIRDDLATVDLVEGIQGEDEPRIAAAFAAKYPGTDDYLMRQARSMYAWLTQHGEPKPKPEGGVITPDEYKWLKEKQFSTQEQVAAFEFALKAAGIHRSQHPIGYLVESGPHVTSIDVRDKSLNGPTVFVVEAERRAVPMTGIVLLPLLDHEIDGHGRQALNGWELMRLGGGPLKFDNEQLYEGYGLRLELEAKNELFGIEETAPRIYYPFAVEMAEQGHSFFEIFSDQVERHVRIDLVIPSDQPVPPPGEIDPKILQQAMKDSWLTTYRVMRGHTDMTNQVGYAMAKDLAYLRGWLIDQQLQRIGAGHFNEAGVITQEGLQMLAAFDLKQSDIPYPRAHVARKYWEEVLKPQMYAPKK